jgi:hypothetical protein
LPAGRYGLAALAALRRDDDRAARLTGAAASAAHRYDDPDDVVDARVTATFLHPARSRFGRARWDAAAREGAALSFDDAIAEALDEPRI